MNRTPGRPCRRTLRTATASVQVNVNVGVDGKPRYVFPRKDCALLPIPNTTVEMLAQMLTERLQAAIGEEGSKPLTAIEMEVEENFGQSAVYRLTL